MEKLRLHCLVDEQGRIETIEISGRLILETAFQLKDELVAIENKCSDKITIRIFELEEMDLSGVQLLKAFIRRMEQMKINCHFNWEIDEEQKLLFINVGIGAELFMNN